MALVTRQSMTDDSGVFTDGTAVNKAFVDQIYDQFDDQLHSSTNPTIKPKTITDEVFTARGSKASLDARLDIAINEDGTLKESASILTIAQGGSFIASNNLAKNGDLEFWTLGGALAPDEFTLAGAGGTIARTGVNMSDTVNVDAGPFAAKLTRAGTDVTLTETIVASADWGSLEAIEGRKVQVRVLVKTAIASHTRVVILDGAGSTAGSYHTGGNAIEALTCTHTISASATKLEYRIEVNTSNGDAYVGGFVCALSEVAISAWPYGSVAARNVVKSIDYQGASAGVGNIGAGKDLLYSRTVKASTLIRDEQRIIGSAYGAFAANANTKELFLEVAGTAILDTGLVAFNGTFWRCEFEITRLSNTSQMCTAMLTITGAAGVCSAYGTFAVTAVNLTTTDMLIAFYGTSGSSVTNDVVQYSYRENMEG